jgi:hypothetical protein
MYLSENILRRSGKQRSDTGLRSPMVQGKELARVVDAPVIDAEGGPEKEKQPQA